MKTKYYTPSFAIIILLLCAGSCTKKDYPQQTESNFKLAVGNFWTYTETYYFNNIWDSLRSTRNMTRKIVKDTLLEEDQLAYIVAETTGNYTYRYIWYEQNNQLIQANFNNEHINVLVASDLKKGLIWDMWPTLNQGPRTDENIVTEEYISYPILSKNVKAFRFENGIKNFLQSNETGHFTEQVYAPEIGIIEETNYTNFFGPTRTHRVLTDYFIN